MTLSWHDFIYDVLFLHHRTLRPYQQHTIEIWRRPLDFSMTITLWSPTYILKVSKFYIEHARFFFKKQFIGWKIIPKVIRYILDWLVDHSAFLKCWLSYMHFLLFSYFCVSNHEPNEKWELPQLDKLCIRFKCIHLVLMIKY